MILADSASEDPLASIFTTAANGAVNALLGQVNQTGVKQQATDGSGNASTDSQSMPTWAMVAIGLGAVYLFTR